MHTRSSMVAGARVLALTFAGLLLSELMLNCTQWWFSHSLRAGGADLDHEALFSTFRMLATVAWVAVLGLGAVAIFGMRHLAAGVPRPRAIRIAAALQGLAVLAGSTSLVVEIGSPFLG